MLWAALALLRYISVTGLQGRNYLGYTTYTNTLKICVFRLPPLNHTSPEATALACLAWTVLLSGDISPFYTSAGN